MEPHLYVYLHIHSPETSRARKKGSLPESLPRTQGILGLRENKSRWAEVSWLVGTYQGATGSQHSQAER